MNQPFAGMKILDLTMNLPGPYMTWLMAVLGAEVLKVENPAGGDYARALSAGKGSASPYFAALNRNKKSMTLNLKHPDSKRIFMELLQTYDILVEGFRPGTMDRLGLGYNHVKEANPRVIYVSISGYGYVDDDYLLRAGHDLNYIALAGILGSIGGKDGRPVIPGIQTADFIGGSMFGTIGLLTAIINRFQTGIGQFVDVSMYDGVLAATTMIYGGVSAGMETPGPSKMLLNGRFPFYQVYETKDGKYMALGAVEGKFWKAFCEGVERNDLTALQYGDETVIQQVRDIFLSKTQSEWLEFFKRVDACCDPVLTLTEVAETELAKNRKLFITVDGTKYVNCPLKLSECEFVEPISAPALGENTYEVLIDLGLSQNDIERLHSEGAI